MKFAPLLLAMVLMPSLSAHAAVGDWVKGQRAGARLIATGIGKDGKLAAGIEIALPPDWTTYWRSPGDAGVPPVIDFSASANVGPAEVSFPVPTRTDEGGDTITNVYRDHVVFPVSLPVLDPAKPVALAVALHIGACKEICVPEDLTLVLTVPAGEADNGAGEVLAAAAALIPGPAEPGAFAIDHAAREGGPDRRPVFRFTGLVPDAAHADVFVEGPADWSPYTPEFAPGADGKPAWTVQFSRTGSKIPIDGARFRLTIRSGDRAIDQTVGLD